LSNQSVVLILDCNVLYGLYLRTNMPSNLATPSTYYFWCKMKKDFECTYTLPIFDSYIAHVHFVYIYMYDRPIN